MFSKGDKVKIKPDSQHQSQGFSRGKALIGVITADNLGMSYKYRVKWENNSTNSYRDIDLEFANQEPQYEIY